MAKIKCMCMIFIVNTRDLKSLGHRLYEFKSRSGYHGKNKNKINDKQCRETTLGWFFCFYTTAMSLFFLSHFLNLRD